MNNFLMPKLDSFLLLRKKIDVIKATKECTQNNPHFLSCPKRG